MTELDIEIVCNIREIRYYIVGTNIHHREDGPAYIDLIRNCMQYLNNGVTTRLDGPATIWMNKHKQHIIYYLIDNYKYIENEYFKRIAK